jgi:hypothetical protein
MSELTVIMDRVIIGHLSTCLTESDIMRLFNIKSKKNTYIDSEGFLEFHDDARNIIIYSDIRG